MAGILDGRVRPSRNATEKSLPKKYEAKKYERTNIARSTVVLYISFRLWFLHRHLLYCEVRFSQDVPS